MSSRETELAWLIDRIKHAEDLIARAEEYHMIHRWGWSPEVDSYFQDMLERKKDQLHYEKHRAEKLGWLVAADQLRGV